MHNRSVGAALLCLAIATSPLAMAAGKKDKPKKATEPPAVVTDVAPPSGAWEAPPQPNNDYVWSKGYYDWKDGRYQWTNGEWVLKKEGMAYQQHQWIKRPDGKYELTGGKWVPNEDAAKAKDDDKAADTKAGADAKRMGAAPGGKR
ncbi:MAG: hypothetical protein ACXWC6_01200 [Ramlibacter sp.]